MNVFSWIALFAAAWLAVLLGCNTTTAAQKDNIIWFFGDSLCSNKAHAAPWHIHQKDWAMVHNLCQPGMPASQFTMPNWIYPESIAGAKVHVVLWIGTNDAAWAGYENIEDDIHRNLQVLTGKANAYRTYIPTLVILPPADPSLDYYQDALAVRESIQAVASQYDNVTVLDIDFDFDATTDGLHPTQAQHKVLATQILDALGIPYN